MGNAPTETTATRTVQVSDVCGTKVAEAVVPAGYSVQELVQTVLPELDLPRNDVSGNPLAYRVHLEREDRQLHASEQVGDVIAEGDKIRLVPDDIEAG